MSDTLTWETAATDEPGDQNATSLRVHGYWAIGPADAGTWSVVLIELDEESDEVEGGGIDLGTFPSESQAKAAAQHYETTGELPLRGEGQAVFRALQTGIDNYYDRS